MNNLMIFENKPVEVFELKGQVLFNPYHCGECLDLTEEGIKSAIKRMNSNQVIKLKNVDISKGSNKPFRKLHNTGENFLTESGVYKLIFKSHKKEAEKFQDWVTDEVLPQIRKTGGYIPLDEQMDDEEFMARALEVAHRTLKKKDGLLKAKTEELEEKNRFINQIAVSENSLKVEDVAQLASKDGIKIGRNRLWAKLREWGLIKQNSKYDPKQKYIDNGYFEVVEGAKETYKGVFTYKTTKVTGRGQVYIINKLIKESKINA
ncbi:phage antirepressor KilAC domain-containing protein [Clostridium sardiniense]|uniref:Phage antirepressor KilAC domain-containing protein n=1 Tax=Clostridium sardiniense TaxID=29369 RepID=A0ABS7KW73_CLOSR|nr:phage antirepressor KilAC domain-containing protein [Clostridium sardiniense]MBY0755063.1 phage antirepressor KilAC domain-containing protein [Clostridium sardiniense]MDQ0459079.1 prophage antirepressor-like protein [Clostridium sardiniense]